jgi:SH3-like domain-containing protein
MSIQVKKGQLRSKPSFLGKIVETLSYGDRVEVLEENVDWMKVGLPGSGLSGWIHNSALTKKKIALRAGSEVAEVSDSEIVIAGKGFTEQVEEEFKLENQEIDYTWIDRMEGEFVISQEEIQDFLKEGDLSPEGGTL